MITSAFAVDLAAWRAGERILPGFLAHWQRPFCKKNIRDTLMVIVTSI
jgi:hypothetical protein